MMDFIVSSLGILNLPIHRQFYFITNVSVKMQRNNRQVHIVFILKELRSWCQPFQLFFFFKC